MSKPYGKTPNLFKRCEETHEILFDEYRLPEFEMLKHITWVGTEKIDGTNIRIIWDAEEETLEIKGRSDKAQIPSDLLETLRSKFSALNFIGLDSMTLYGEGYGKKIQGCGSRYCSDSTNFILFDVRCGHWWLKREDIIGIAANLGVGVVTIAAKGTLAGLVSYLTTRPTSSVAEDKTLVIEGLVVQPEIPLLLRNGDRVKCKIKMTDIMKLINQGELAQ
jgi:hypothetical protein